MTAATDHSPANSPARTDGRTLISVDAMGGDEGPAAIVAGCSLSAKINPDIAFVLHGDTAQLDPLLAKRPELQGRCETRHAADVVSMDDKPSQVVRTGKGTSMWSAIEAVRSGEASRRRVLWQHRRADGDVNDPPAQTARREPPCDCRALSFRQPAGF